MYTQMTPKVPPKVMPQEAKLYTAVALGLVGTGKTPTEARQNLFEKIRQAGEP